MVAVSSKMPDGGTLHNVFFDMIRDMIPSKLSDGGKSWRLESAKSK
jgi:hypothetical protein